MPDNAINSTSYWHDRRSVLGGDLEEVPEDVVLNEVAAVIKDFREVRSLTVGGVLRGVGHFMRFSEL